MVLAQQLRKHSAKPGVHHFLTIHHKNKSDTYIGATAPATLYHETDLRFWKQTNYKVGQKLDINNASDKPYIPVWNKIYQQVTSEDKAGKLVHTPESLTSSPVQSQIDAHQAQADIHKAQADNHVAQAADNAQAAILASQIAQATNATDEVKAAAQAKADVHVAQSNAHAEQAKNHQEQANVHTDIVKSLTDIHTLSGLSYLAAKAWLATPNNSQYFGWVISKDGTVDTKWTDSSVEINDWFGNLGIGNFSNAIWGLYYQKGHTDSSGTVIPVDEFRPEITQATADAALNAALGKAQAQANQIVQSTPITSKTSQSSGAGLAVMLALGLGGLAVASSKKK
jgi:hypothetical protein